MEFFVDVGKLPFSYDELMDAVYEMDVENDVSTSDIHKVSRGVFGAEAPTFSYVEVSMPIEIAEKLAKHEKIGKYMKLIIEKTKAVGSEYVFLLF